MDNWILFTLFAALMQAVRTAGQKQLSNEISPMSSTLVRYVYGLPFVAAYYIFINGEHSLQLANTALDNSRFLLYAVLASISQIIATALLVKVFSYRNFAVGTSFAKTEAVQAAVFGMLFFGATLSVVGWMAVFIGFIGIVVVGMPPRNQRWELSSIVIGTLSGSCFGLTSVWLREASLSLGVAVLQSAAATLLFMVTLQSLLCLAYTQVKERSEFKLILQRSPLALFVGLTSALGSAGWFTAMTYQNPALVKSLGQVEFLFTFMISVMLFKESISFREVIGIVAITASVILLMLFT